MRPTLSWAPASAALALYFMLVGITGAIVGNLNWDGVSRAFTIAFFIGFVLSVALIQQAARRIAGLRSDVSLGSLIVGPLALLAFILIGFFLARIMLLRA